MARNFLEEHYIRWRKSADPIAKSPSARNAYMANSDISEEVMRELDKAWAEECRKPAEEQANQRSATVKRIAHDTAPAAHFAIYCVTCGRKPRSTTARQAVSSAATPKWHWSASTRRAGNAKCSTNTVGNMAKLTHYGSYTFGRRTACGLDLSKMQPEQYTSRTAEVTCLTCLELEAFQDVGKLVSQGHATRCLVQMIKLLTKRVNLMERRWRRAKRT